MTPSSGWCNTRANLPREDKGGGNGAVTSTAMAVASMATVTAAVGLTSTTGNAGLCRPQNIPSFGGLRAASSARLSPRRVSVTVPGRCRRAVCPRAIELDSDTLLAVGVGLSGLFLGIAIPAFYEGQTKGAETRENDQPCFPCKGTGAQACRFCLGSGSITVELGGGEKEVSQCLNCDGKGNITCTTCQGSGIQPRYLDRREYKDDD